MGIRLIDIVLTFGFIGSSCASAFGSVSRGWTINPFKVAKPVAGAAGIVAPKFVRKNIELLEEIFGVDDAQWTVFGQTVVLQNCAVGFKNHTDPALRIGRLAVHWDSLSSPMIDIEVEDVEVSVEFANLLMTKTNWNEIVNGASPLFDSYEATNKWFGWDEDSDDDFLHFNSINLLGNLTMKFRSRPLDEDLGKVSVAMNIEELTSQISSASDRNFELSGKRGCSTVELTSILRGYFTKKLRVLIRSFAKDPDNALTHTGDILEKAKGLVLDYTRRTRIETIRRLAKHVMLRFANIGEQLTVLLNEITENFKCWTSAICHRLGLQARPKETLLLKFSNTTDTLGANHKGWRGRWFIF